MDGEDDRIGEEKTSSVESEGITWCLSGEGVKRGDRYDEGPAARLEGVLWANEGKFAVRFVGLWETYSEVGVEAIMVVG